MKKIYIFILAAFVICGIGNAQTLTKVNNEPVSGDIAAFTRFDSVTAIPKATGLNKSWNFTSVAQTTNVSGYSFTTASSVPQNSLFTGATLAQNQGGGSYSFYKSSGSNFEMLGTTDGTNSIVFSNSMLASQWPISYGTTFTDTYSGATSGGTLVANMNGTLTVTGSGTGTITLPGGQVFNGVLQLKQDQKILVSLTSPLPVTFTNITTGYSYFHSSKKFELLTVTYNKSYSFFGDDTTATVLVNNNFVLGITDKNFDATFQVFPNPAHSNFNLALSNPNFSGCTLTIYNGNGQLIRSLDLGNDPFITSKVDISGLETGIYLVQTRLGDKTSVRRLIIE